MGTVVRTCIGCRERADATSLLRFVVVQESTTAVVTPDPDRSLPGRGAHLHPDPRCLQLATRRKAWGRALRHAGQLDLTAAEHHLAPPAPTEEAPTGASRPEIGA